jgi:hypothetical protein
VKKRGGEYTKLAMSRNKRAAGGGRKPIKARAMTPAERQRRSRAGIPKAEREGPAVARFAEVLRATLPYVRPEPPRWFRGREPLVITKGRPSWVADKIHR